MSTPNLSLACVSGVSNRSRSSSSDADSRSSSSSSESSETSSESSWTGSLEVRFRRMITSEQGRKLLAEEVEALAARQARHAQRQSARGRLNRVVWPLTCEQATLSSTRRYGVIEQTQQNSSLLLGAWAVPVLFRAGITASRRGPRRGRTKTSANARLERFPGEKEDVEMALLGATDTG